MDKVIKLSIHELAKEAFSSPSTIMRFVKKLGFKGFKEFKQDLMVDLALRERTRMPQQKELERTDSYQDIIDKISYRHMISIERTKELMDIDVFKNCIERMIGVEQIYVFGIGASFLAAKDLQQKMMRIGKNCFAFEDYHLQILQARNMKPKDLALIVSYSGQTEEMVKCSEIVKDTGATLISITRFGGSKIASLADYNLYIASNEPLRRSGAMTSRMAQLFMVDMLYLAYVHRTYDQSYKNIGKTQLEKIEE